uniref:Uncharacterized protein n=1 Tax=Crocodylus porosus TaxID=8502 RepID=A0A7M4E1M8_CROPO
MLTSCVTPEQSASNFLEVQVEFSHPRLSNNRSVTPLGVQGCMCATLTGSACVYLTPTGVDNPLNPICDEDCSYFPQMRNTQEVQFISSC